MAKKKLTFLTKNRFVLTSKTYQIAPYVSKVSVDYQNRHLTFFLLEAYEHGADDVISQIYIDKLMEKFDVGNSEELCLETYDGSGSLIYQVKFFDIKNLIENKIEFDCADSDVPERKITVNYNNCVRKCVKTAGIVFEGCEFAED